MKKTAQKTKTRTVASKKVTKTPKVNHTAGAVKHKSLVHHYVHQRDSFYENHPNSRVLLGIFIVLLAAFIGIWFWGEMKIMNETIKMETEAFYQ